MNIDKDNRQDCKRVYRLYDEAYWLLFVALIYFSYDAITNDRDLQARLVSALNVTFWWVLVLFKIHKIEYRDNTLVFKGILRRITVNPKDIISLQDALRRLRLVLKDKSIILWPFIERQGEFKILLQSLNPDIKLVDVSNEATKSTTRLGFIFFGLIILFGLSIAGLLYQITHSQW